jgi:cytochrome bd-type quinol oxidase subunit 1
MQSKDLLELSVFYTALLIVDIMLMRKYIRLGPKAALDQKE